MIVKVASYSTNKKLWGYVAKRSRNTLSSQVDLSRINYHTCGTHVILGQSVDLMSGQILSPRLPPIVKHTSPYGPIIPTIQPRNPILV